MKVKHSELELGKKYYFLSEKRVIGVTPYKKVIQLMPDTPVCPILLNEYYDSNNNLLPICTTYYDEMKEAHSMLVNSIEEGVEYDGI